MTSAALPIPAATNAGRRADIALAIVVVLVIALIVVPLPPALLDLCLAASIGVSIVVLLVALYTNNPLDFSSFPALLLLLTLFRIGLNVSSTRLILADGHAGKVIEAFGHFVVGGNYAVGIVIFLMLVGINFIVITKGAGRIAEVSARFTLDAMPGKQMAIDADLSAGLIDEKEARTRRDEISRTADFYGAMDGASKYVKGDAILGILVVFVNIIGGIFIGVVQRDMPLAKAASTFTLLTVGDGLVSQIPALIISTAAGLMVTSATGTDRMGVVVSKQLGAHPRAMWIAAAVLGSFGLIPGLPMLPFLILGGGAAWLAKTATRNEAMRMQLAQIADIPVEEAPPAADPMHDLLQIDPIELEVGYALIPLVDEGEGGDLLERISLLRKQAALELGILVPPIRIRDDIRLPANEYIIKLRGSEVARAEVLPRFLMALNTGSVVAEIDGMETVDPSFGMPARWIANARRTEAEALGYVVVEPTTVVATHLLETLKSSAAELLGRQEVQEMVETLKKSHPALIEEIIPGKVSLSVLHRVLQRLLKERVPIRDLVTILEALGDGAEGTRDPEALTEVVRKSLTNVIARLYADQSGTVRGITIGSRLESALVALFSPRSAQTAAPMLTPETLASLLRELNHLSTTYAADGRPLPLITPPSLRVGVRRLIEPVLPSLPVVSLAELPSSITLSSVATWEMPHAS